MTRDDVLKIMDEARKKGEVPNLSGCDLRGSNLRGCDLRGCDLSYCNLDFSCWPLWCGTKGVKVDIRIVRQLLAHIAVLECDDPLFKEIRETILSEAKKSHRAKELGLLDKAKGKP